MEDIRDFCNYFYHISFNEISKSCNMAAGMLAAASIGIGGTQKWIKECPQSTYYPTHCKFWILGFSLIHYRFNKNKNKKLPRPLFLSDTFWKNSNLNHHPNLLWAKKEGKKKKNHINSLRNINNWCTAYKKVIRKKECIYLIKNLKIN